MLVVKGHGIAKKEKEMIIQNQREELFYIFSIHCKFKLTQSYGKSRSSGSGREKKDTSHMQPQNRKFF